MQISENRRNAAYQTEKTLYSSQQAVQLHPKNQTTD